MILTPEQQSLLDGARGETMAKVVKTLVMYGEAFDAKRMVPVTGQYGHTVISFGLKVLSPVYDLYQKLIDEGLLSGQQFTADPRPLDRHVPSNLLEDVVFKKINQLFSEFMDALQAAINQMSVDGVRISQITSKSRELSKYMAQTLDEDWSDLRGIEVCSVGIASISYDDESKELINMRNKGAMMGDPNIREGFVQASVAQGIQAAGSNTAGAGTAFMGVGMGMNAAGGFMSTASQTNAYQMQQQAQAQAAQAQAAQSGWTCSCGTVNQGNFCGGCGKPKPAPAGSWTCECGTVNQGNFCGGCGKPKPAADGKWTCSCGTVNEGKFCGGCGKPRA